MRHPLQKTVDAQETYQDAHGRAPLHLQTLQLQLQDQGQLDQTHEVQSALQEVHGDGHRAGAHGG